MAYRKIFVLSYLFMCFSNQAQISFSNETLARGLNVDCGNAYNGSGISFYDYDGDGFDDLTIATAQGDPVRFFKNYEGFFIEQNLGIDYYGSSKQINWVDIDNDSDNDLFITSENDKNRLYENVGAMIFVEITGSSGMLSEVLFTHGSSWGDYNNDGYLDVFICNRDSQIPNILYKNNGDNTFSIVNDEVGIISNGTLSFCSAFLDFNNDGYQDLYVANDKTIYSNTLYKNNGDGTFTDVSQITGTDIAIDAMSVTVDDFNNDGWLDIYVTNGAEGNVLLKNNGNETFTDIGLISNTTVNSDAWGAVFLDADNDKDLDLYVSCEQSGIVPNFLSSAFFESNGDETFFLNNNAVPGDFAKSYSNAIGDIDNNGLVDLVVNNINHDNIYLWKNNTQNSNNWLKVKLEGTVSNRNGIGSFIEISLNNEKQYRYTLCGEGYLSQNSGIELFGLNQASIVDYVKIKWLSGIEDVFYGVEVNQVLKIIEGTTLSIQNSEKNTFSFHPNPVTNTLTLNAQKNIEEVTMFNMLGQTVLMATPNALSSELDMSALNSGAYFVKVSVDGATKTVRVIKQ